MKKLHILLTAALAATLFSCAKDDSECTDCTTIDPAEVVISAAVDPVQAWASGDEIGLFMFPHGGTPGVDTYPHAHNLPMSTTGNGIFSSGTMLSLPSNKVDFVAYHPYRDDIATMVYDVDLRDQSDQKAIDLLYARSTNGFSDQSAGVALTMAHKLASFTFNFTELAGEDMAGTTVVITGMRTRSSFNLSSEGFADYQASTADIDANFTVSATQGKGTAVAILLPAAALAGRTLEIEVPGTGGSYTWKFPDGLTIQGGMKYTYGIDLDAVTWTAVTTTSSITPWGTVTVPSSRVKAVSGYYGCDLQQQGSTDVFEGVFTLNDNRTFDITIDGTKYGIVAYSGNGGVGTVLNSYEAATAGFVRTVNTIVKSYGLMSTTGNPIWVNTDGGGEIFVRVDLTTPASPTCYVELVDRNPNLILSEGFDLMVWGGSWVDGQSLGRSATLAGGIAGTKGYEPATASSTVGATSAGPGPFHSATAEHATYIASRGLTGWLLNYCFEFPGYIRMNDNVTGRTNDGEIGTPALSKIGTGTANLTVNYDVCRFVSTDTVAFVIEGPGTITAASYVDDVVEGVTYGNGLAAHAPKTTVTNITVAAGAKYIPMTGRNATLTTGMTPEFNGVNGFQKFFTRFTVTVTGADATTKLKWMPRSTGADAKGFRMLLDNVRVVKTN